MKLIIIPISAILILSLGGCSPSKIYISSEFEDKVYPESSICILYPKPVDYRGTDSSSNALYQSFEEYFTKYFPEGGEIFSSINKAQIFAFDEEEIDSEYEIKNSGLENNYLSIPKLFKRRHTKCLSDFCMIIHGLSWSIDYKNKKDNKEGYLSHFYLVYSIWDNFTGKLISAGNVDSEQSCKLITIGWPYKSSMYKLATETFNNLPMFSKN